MTLLEAAVALHKAGCSVVPVRPDGSKAPALHWKGQQTNRATVDQLEQWFTGTAYDGLGVVTGAVSANLEMLELEGRATALGEQLVKLMADNGAAELWQRLCDGYMEQSPSGGWHWIYRVAGEAKPNTKLASRPATPEELDAHRATERTKAESTLTDDALTRRLARIDAMTPAQLPQVLIETRGEGGFTVVAPSNGRTHPTGKPWALLRGAPSTIPTITPDERDQIYAIAGMLDTMPRPAAASTERQGAPTFDGRDGRTRGDRPGDDFNARASWTDILTPHGWTAAGSLKPGETSWVRPGKTAAEGISATTGANEADNLYVFSTSTEFETDTPYSKFAAYALLEHRGDYTAAARDLRARGYGSQDDFSAFGLASPTVLTTPGTDNPAGPGGPGNPGTVLDPAGDPPPRPPLEVTNVAVAADNLRRGIGTGALAGMFRRGNDLVYTPRQDEAGYVPPANGDEDGLAQIRVIRKPTVLATYIQLAYNVFKMQGRVDDRRPVAAMYPIDAARTAVEVPHKMPNLRQLDGVVHSPVLRPDGTLLEYPGYDDQSRLLHLPERGLTVPPVAEHPSRDQVTAAVGLLDEMTAGFNFVGPDDRANYYGLLLTPLLRLMTPPPYKLGAITSPSPGSGKTLLATVARIIHSGVFRSEFPGEEELRKQVTAILTQTTGPIVHFDNLSGILRSSTLAGLLTSAEWGDRPLGATEWVGTPNDRLWLVTGNNVALGGDLLRRTVWVSIDPGVPNPERRTGFAIDDLERWATDRRGDLLHALLTMIRAWVAAGSPTPPPRASDGYSQWTQTVTGILQHASVPGVFSSEESAPQVLGHDDDDWGDFLEAVHQVFGDQPWSVKELLEKIDTSGRYDPYPVPVYDRPIKVDVLPGDLATRAVRESLPAIGKSLGRYLMNRSGRWAGGLTVRKDGVRAARQTYWRIEGLAQTPQTHQTQGESAYAPMDEFGTAFAGTGEPLPPNSAAGNTPHPQTHMQLPLAPCAACKTNPAPSTSIYCHPCLSRAREGQ